MQKTFKNQQGRVNMQEFHKPIDNKILMPMHMVYICSINKGKYVVNPNQPSVLTEEQCFLLNTNDLNFCFWTKQEMEGFINLKNMELDRLQTR